MKNAPVQFVQINEKTKTSNPNSKNIGYVVFLGNLLNLTEYSSDPSNLLKSLIRGDTRVIKITESSALHVEGLRDRLKYLTDLGVKIVWLAGSEELNVNQEILRAINRDDSIAWIQVCASKLLVCV